MAFRDKFRKNSSLRDLSDFLPVTQVDDVFFFRNPLSKHPLAKGTLLLNRHHLSFISPNYHAKILYTKMFHITSRSKSPNDGSKSADRHYIITIHSRDYLVYSIILPDGVDRENFYQTLISYRPASFQNYPALAQSDGGTPRAGHVTPTGTFDEGWKIYDPHSEYRRMGVETVSKMWRISSLNDEYSLCDTYPKVIAVPAEASDAILEGAAKFRSRCRLPILSYLYLPNGASISRSSQPLAGLASVGKRSTADETLVSMYFSAAEKDRAQRLPGFTLPGGATGTQNHIVDARPRVNAIANAAMGKGFEQPDFYQNCTREFLGIDNIHVMRESLDKLLAGVLQSDQSISGWYGALDSSGWLKHMQIIMRGTLKMVRYVLDGGSILVHCSDGWDRTAQLAGLAEVCLDPYYRTRRGFAVLVEKEWLAAGHKFAHRIGHSVYGKASSQYSEVSPVFIQFLEAVWQLSQQYPQSFEFTGTWLRALWSKVVGCDSGTFLFNCERERHQHGLPTGSPSAWAELLWPTSDWLDFVYTNQFYQAPASLDPMAGRGSADAPRILLPQTAPHGIRFWREMYAPFEEEPLALDLFVPCVQTPGGYKPTWGPSHRINIWNNATFDLRKKIAAAERELADLRRAAAGTSPGSAGESVADDTDTISASTTPSSQYLSDDLHQYPETGTLDSDDVPGTVDETKIETAVDSDPESPDLSE
ncbi:hypothetical protein H696_03655 [Fonticula alba]|uniref:Myotubularin phosphatase domain-containing protein n=1 Tax=Fonticula alba TaxID=691883 RepID=A0A058Z9J5_FONAL|nr:hypothetical protein H696_03655 [Fonticula alba]KCV70197.1 hypothetical protein H696_03655 [Fonticula alba]|eukprot:XP_009495803.1 hypothetical protein H696_03655 [Fonticula alba]